MLALRLGRMLVLVGQLAGVAGWLGGRRRVGRVRVRRVRGCGMRGGMMPGVVMLLVQEHRMNQVGVRGVMPRCQMGLKRLFRTWASGLRGVLFEYER